MRLFRRSNGVYYVEIERGKPFSLITKNQQDAYQIYRTLKKEALLGRFIKLDTGQSITLNEYKEIFLKESIHIADKTYSFYSLVFKLLADSIGGSTLLSRIEKPQISKFIKDCLDRGAKRVSINSYLRGIRRIFNKAYNDDIIKKKVKIELFKLGKRYPRILSNDDISKILFYAKENNFEMYRYIKFALFTGCRRAEIWSLTWKDVFENYFTVIGKGDKERSVPLLPEAIDAMGNRKDIGPVFYRYPDIDRITKEFKAITRACGIDDVNFHRLRHTAATHMLKSGVPLKYVKEILGHADITTTEIYAQALKDELISELRNKFHYDGI